MSDLFIEIKYKDLPRYLMYEGKDSKKRKGKGYIGFRKSH